MFDNLDMHCPVILCYGLSGHINPLTTVSTPQEAKNAFNYIQCIIQSGLVWIAEAQRRAVLIGPRCGWSFPSVVYSPEEPLPGITPRLIELPSISDVPAAVVYQPAPHNDNTPAAPPSSPVPNNSSPLYTASTSFAACTHPESGPSTCDEMVLHPQYSRFAHRYPFIDVFDRESLVENGYVSDDSMDVDDEY